LVTAAEADYQVAHQLDRIRLEASTLVDGKCNVAQAGPKYEAFFLNTLKLDLRNGRLPALAAHFKGSALRYVLVAALDHWADVTTDKELVPRLLEVARLADPEPWRDEVRNGTTWQDVRQLKKLARDVKPRQQLPQTLLLLAHRLFDKRAEQAASALLRTALLHHPADFWLNIQLGNLTDDPGEKVGCYRAALAIRPGTLSAYNNLGVALYEKKDVGGALQTFRQAIVLDPKNASFHYSVGYVLYAMKDLDGAIREYNKAIALDPRNAPSHYNLGLALKDKGDREGAIQAWQKAIELDPKHALSHNNLGLALASKDDLDGAIKEIHQAIVLDPKCAFLHFNLGNVLRARGDLGGAIKEYQKAIELDPRDARSHHSLGHVLHDMKDEEGALQEYKKAIEFDPKYAQTYNSLGNALSERGDLEGAIRAYHKAIDLDLRDALPHYNLGKALKARGDLEAAVACYKKALTLDGKIAQAHHGLGHALLLLGRFAEAREATARALQLLSSAHPLQKTAQKQLVQCEQLMALDQKLTMVLTGQAQPAHAGEQLILAHLCRMYKQQYALAARFYAAAFAAAPELAGELTKPRRYQAACAAALAAAGRGKDSGRLDAPARAKLRQQALGWLEADLGLWQRQATGDAAARQALVKALSHWQTDPDLAGVRGDQALAQLPEGERKQWQALWADVAQLLHKARS
jgi:tetratricopeptide (TPR) repeat protein